MTTRQTTRQKIRAEMLKCRPHGITASDLAARLGLDPNLIRVTLGNMDDAYIYKWQLTPEYHSHVAVWKCVIVPENAVRPKVEPKSRKQYDKIYRRKRKAKEIEAKAQPEPVANGPKTTWVTPPPWSH